MPLFPKEMKSDRLRYERLHPENIDPFELYKHVRIGAPNVEEITEYVAWSPYEHPKEAFDWVERCGNLFEDGKDATYVLRIEQGNHAGELAGLAGIHPSWDRRLATMGTWIRKQFWGQGYSGERAAQMLELAFDRLGLDVVAVTHDPENETSRVLSRNTSTDLVAERRAEFVTTS